MFSREKSDDDYDYEKNGEQDKKEILSDFIVYNVRSSRSICVL